jgi:hypothetical protein
MSGRPGATRIHAQEMVSAGYVRSDSSIPFQE